ncbi:hypothetical protein ACH47B_18615 [Rhodococcus sp. NPDC019627]|uniref:hypothetical protein n=1 Tax=unclassified Rhodococcus (in: high G+C Gram-positive bacteria) TaxID=192944 RepID=UPI00340780B5
MVAVTHLGAVPVMQDGLALPQARVRRTVLRARLRPAARRRVREPALRRRALPAPGSVRGWPDHWRRSTSS